MLRTIVDLRRKGRRLEDPRVQGRRARAIGQPQRPRPHAALLLIVKVSMGDDLFTEQLPHDISV